VCSLGPHIVDFTHSILSLAHHILYFVLISVTLFPITPLMSQHASSSKHIIYSQSNERGDRDYTTPSNIQELPFLEGESLFTTGMKAPVIAKHLNAHTHMSVITVSVEELTGDQTIQSHSLNQGLSRG
jgi:hypothetical protein